MQDSTITEAAGTRRRRRRSGSKGSAQRRLRRLKKIFYGTLFVIFGSALTVWVAIYLGSARG
jgi:hypothetical protein